MDAEQGTRRNPFGMDEQCQRCPELCESRSQVVHGYGDVGADFLLLGTAPSGGADGSGIPFTGTDRAALDIFAGFDMVEFDGDQPVLDNLFVTHVTRCYHPERGPTDEEVRNCDAYMTSEVRMINPEIIVPVGQRALEALAFEYTTRSAEEFDVVETHADTIAGRGFELVPMVPPGEQSPAQREAFVEHLEGVLNRDYRQTKGRRGR